MKSSVDRCNCQWREDISHENLESYEVIDWRKNVKKVANVWENYANS